jgi:hypothetical protein
MYMTTQTTQSVHPTHARANRTIRFMARTALVAAAAALALQIPLQAQSNPASAPRFDLNASLTQPLNLTAPAANSDTPYSSSISSSSSVPSDTVAIERLNLDPHDALQPPPRRSYGKPRYADSTHNADGSNKWTFIVGGGFTLPVGGTHNYFSPSYKFQVGGGRAFNKNFAVLAQFDWDNFGIQTHTLNTLLPIYASLCGLGCTGLPVTQIGGNGHDWSFTLNPVYTFLQGDTMGAYVVGGIGFYHKVSTFTTPTVGTYCDPFYGCFQYGANSTIDEYTSNAVGFNGGFGFTYRFSRFAGEKFYAEGRYVYTANSPRPFSLGSTTSNYFNVFPQNSAKTTYIPITFGIRF